MAQLRNESATDLCHGLCTMYIRLAEKLGGLAYKDESSTQKAFSESSYKEVVKCHNNLQLIGGIR